MEDRLQVEALRAKVAERIAEDEATRREGQRQSYVCLYTLITERIDKERRLDGKFVVNGDCRKQLHAWLASRDDGRLTRKDEIDYRGKGWTQARVNVERSWQEYTCHFDFV
jgi:hypothetical protein